MLQYPGVIPADGMVLRPGVFGYGRLVCEALLMHMRPYAPSDVFQAGM